MTMLGTLRDRVLTRDAAEAGSEGRDDPAAPLPFDGFDDVALAELVQDLSDHSQIELDAVETYERAHKGRDAVLDKLRYLRGPEPIPGYDALDVDEILAKLGDADLTTVKRIRGYERKFAKRPDLLEEVVRTQRARRAALPTEAAPAYQPLSAKKSPPAH